MGYRIKEIEWKTTSSSTRGFVGGDCLFILYWDAAAPKGYKGPHIKMNCALPGFTYSVTDKRYETYEDAKEEARKILRKHVKKLLYKRRGNNVL